MSDSIGTEACPLRVAVIGSGPSGFYAAEALLRDERPATVDVYDRLPTPYGLVRGGVAPDHEKIKKVVATYQKVAARPGFGFYGNVHLGRDVDVGFLRRHYDAVVLAVGAETDRRLGIPGEDLPGSHTATEFVGWYNGHPDYRERHFDLSSEVAVVIGHGNVAMDVSRILAKTVDELRATDIAAHALEALAESKVREIHVIGRRGPVQAKFTPPEIREVGELQNCEPVVDPGDLELDPASAGELEASRDAQKNLEILRGFAERSPGAHTDRRYRVWFLHSPVALEGDGRVERVVLERNRLEGEAGALKARSTGEQVRLDAGLFFRSVGYRGIPIPGVPFDDRRGVIPNVAGRVVESDGTPVPGLYVAGWIKRGPSGIIGTNRADAKETVTELLADVAKLPVATVRSREAVEADFRERGVRFVTFEDWERLDALEVEAGQAVGKPREKLTRVAEMLAALDAQQ